MRKLFKPYNSSSWRRLIFRSEKNELTEEAHRIIKAIKQMELSIEDQQHANAYQLEYQDLKVSVPLTRCLQTLKEKHNTIAKVHRERFEQVQSKFFPSIVGRLNNLDQSLFRLWSHIHLTWSHLSFKLLYHLHLIALPFLSPSIFPQPMCHRLTKSLRVCTRNIRGA